MKALIFLLCSALSVSAQDHFSKAYHLNDLCLVLEEGGLEDPGQGSYTIRLHKWLDHSAWPAGDLYSGIVRPRNGTIANVLFVDLDGKKDAVVTIRSIGTGGYLDADAFSVEGKQLKLMSSVKDLRPEEGDQTLTSDFSNRPGDSNEWSAGQVRQARCGKDLA